MHAILAPHQDKPLSPSNLPVILTRFLTRELARVPKFSSLDYDNLCRVISLSTLHILKPSQRSYFPFTAILLLSGWTDLYLPFSTPQRRDYVHQPLITMQGKTPVLYHFHSTVYVHEWTVLSVDDRKGWSYNSAMTACKSPCIALTFNEGALPALDLILGNFAQSKCLTSFLQAFPILPERLAKSLLPTMPVFKPMTRDEIIHATSEEPVVIGEPLQVVTTPIKLQSSVDCCVVSTAVQENINKVEPLFRESLRKLGTRPISAAARFSASFFNRSGSAKKRKRESSEAVEKTLTAWEQVQQNPNKFDDLIRKLQRKKIEVKYRVNTKYLEEKGIQSACNNSLNLFESRPKSVTSDTSRRSVDKFILKALKSRPSSPVCRDTSSKHNMSSTQNSFSVFNHTKTSTTVRGAGFFAVKRKDNK